MRSRNAVCAVILAVVGITGASFDAHAQSGQVVPNALQGFSHNRDKPIQIKAQTFEVRDKQKTATFSGNVQVMQGEATIRCQKLIVTYVSDADANTTGGAVANAGPGGKSQISKLEALGRVIVTQKDQTATGDSGLFDLNTKIITLSGNVVVSQGGNVMRGERMVVDLNTGVSRFESAKGNEPVRMLIPQSQPNSKPAPGGVVPAPPKFDLLRPGQSN